MNKTVFSLIGMRAVGKTTIGEALAQHLHYTWIDLDRHIESQQGIPIASLFQQLGESHFRTLERHALQEVLHRAASLILATGGGTVEMPDNQILLRESTIPIFLYCDLEVLAKRLLADNSPSPMKRPSLSTLPPLDEIEMLWQRRSAIYYQLAKGVIDTSRLNIQETVTALIDLLGANQWIPKRI